MRQKRVSGLVLALAVFLSAAFSGLPGAYAAETTTDRAFQSALTEQTPRESYAPGDTIRLELAVNAAYGESYRLRGYDNTITVDDRIFEVKKVESMAQGVTVQPDYEAAAGDNVQKIKLVYWNSAPAEQTEPLTVAGITLQVKEGAANTTSKVTQKVEGITDGAGLLAKTIAAEARSFSIRNTQAGFRFHLEVSGGAQSGYAPLESVIVHSYVKPEEGVIDASMATNDIIYDPEVFDLISVKKGTGVQTSAVTAGGLSRVTAVYSGGAKVGESLELCQLTLRVKGNVSPGDTAIQQANYGLLIGGVEAVNAAADPELTLRIVGAESTAFTMIPETAGSLKAGEELRFVLRAEPGQPLSPRLMQAELGYAKNTFDFVTASAILNRTLVNERNGKIIWVYHDSSQLPEVFTEAVTIGSVTLRVKKTAATGSSYINIEEANIELSDGSLAAEVRTSPLAVKIIGEEFQGAAVRGTVALTTGDVAKATVVLTKNEIADAAAAYGYEADEANGDYTAQVGEDGSYELEAVEEGTYTLLIRKPGALYYQKNGLAVGSEDAELADTVTLPVGDLNMDGTVNDGDLGELISSTNFNKGIGDEGVLIICDLNGDGSINDGDLGELISAANFNQTAIVEEAE